MTGRRGWVGVVLLAVGAGSVWASGPRYVTGPPFFTGAAGKPVVWKQANLMYSTDPGDLGPFVNHAAADALVAAAAGVWNIPVAGIAPAQGGSLAEHVSGENVYLSNDGMAWPSDVASSNYASVPVAVVYDTDGSVIETLLGAGASDPSGCGQNGVIESVDRFDPAGYILHAVMVLNGRCTGATPEQQLQMQYQLERAFGRVLGLAWSQTNDNVFTGLPQPNYDQAAHWPIMHPLDIFCGSYSFECLPEPFTLRPDDIAGLVGLYPIAAGSPTAAGKQASLQDANPVQGFVTFPDGQGMAGVNVLVRRTPRFSTIEQDWVETSAISGSSFRRAGVSPFVLPPQDVAGSSGTLAMGSEGYYFVPYVAVADPTNAQGETISTEPLNPLYLGSASVGPYAAGIVSPAGLAPLPLLAVTGPTSPLHVSFSIADAPATCGDGTDGTMGLPMALPASGWWNGLLCGYGHASYVAVLMKAGRSFTVEVTALDESGFATTGKAMPVIGMFGPSDVAGGLPSIAVAPMAFTSNGVGTTALSAWPFARGGAGGVVRVGIADQRGDGRPDFSFRARVFYADSLTPSSLGREGGTVTITGTGFRPGSAVTINGAQAKVTSWTPTTIVLTAPPMAAVGATSGTAVDVEVDDRGTGATSTMSAALVYDLAGRPPNTMKLVSAPTSTMLAGDNASVPFTVQVLGGDGLTPVAGDTVVFSGAGSGAVQFSACGAVSCSGVTDARGMVSTAVIAEAAGTVTITAAEGAPGGSPAVSASFEVQTKPAAMRLTRAPAAAEKVGVAAATAFQVQLVDGKGTGIAGELVTFSVMSGGATFGACNAAPCSVVTNAYGQAQVVVTPTAVGPVTLRASDGDLSQATSFTAAGNQATMALVTAPAANSYVNEGGSAMKVQLLQGDGVTPLTAVPVVFTAPAGVIWSACGSNTCTIETDWQGGAGSGLRPTVTGTFALQATYGSLSESATMNVGVRTKTLTLLSTPSGSLPVGVMSGVPFTAQLLDGWGHPVVNQSINFGGIQGMVKMSCGLGSCFAYSDANGEVSSSVTPLEPGQIVLTATTLNINATSSFTAVGAGESLTIIQAPPGNVFVGDKVAFSVQVMGADGMTPVAGRAVSFAVLSGTVAIDQCASGSCRLTTNAQGVASLMATASVSGLVTWSASIDGLTRQISFAVAAKSYRMNVVTAPSGSVAPGMKLREPYAVQVVGADGVTPAAGQNVTFSMQTGMAQLAACFQTPCVVKTDAHGMASTGFITAGQPGPVTIGAADNSLTQTASFNVSVPADLLMLLPGTPATVLQGATTTTPFGARLTLPDGVTPVPGVPVVLSSASGGDGGAVSLAACGASSCNLVTDANGKVMSAVTGMAAGNVTLTATAQLPTGDQSVSGGLQVVANARSVTALQPMTYVPEGATVDMTLDVTAVQNGVPAVGQVIAWSGAADVAPAMNSSTTDAMGKSFMAARVGPLSEGMEEGARACGWTTACGEFHFAAVSLGALRISIVGGGRQSATGGTPPVQVTAQVTDAEGHSVAGATVTVGQTVRAFDASCPMEGRCPAGAVLASSNIVSISDIDGRVAVAPQVVPGTPTATAMAFSTGTEGFATAEVFRTP